MPVIVIDDADHAIPLAEALLEGGINWIEITLRTEAALNAIRKIAVEVPQMLVGAGTVVTVDHAKKALDAGATFGLAPGLYAPVLNCFKEAKVPFIPGICSPSEITLAYSIGCKRLKFFPAESCGGVAYLKSANAPFRSLGIQYCPTGGLNENNMKGYLELPEVFTIGGSWIATQQQIRNQDWSIITQQARAALEKAG